MDLLTNLHLGFAVALTLKNLGFAFMGCLVGTLVGVLPGVGPTASIAMLLPITFGLDPVSALIMLAGIYYGAQYGGSTTAILVAIPGEASSVMTVMDGHQMAMQGRAGVALGIAAIGSFIAGTIATFVILSIGNPLTKVALLFGPHDYFSLMVLGLVLAVVFAQGSIVKAIAMVLLGVLFSAVGSDLESGVERMTFGLNFLYDGIDFVVLSMGLFGFAEIVRNLETEKPRQIIAAGIKRILPNLSELRQSMPAIFRGTALGAVLGILPGGGSVLGPFASYAAEKKLATEPGRFGKGAIEGVAGPEAANNAGAQLSFVPLLTLGIPSNSVMALMVGAMMIHGIVPGPQVATRNPDLFWGLIVSMWIGNLMLLILNLPMVRIWVQLLRVPYDLLFPCILVFSAVGIYSINNSEADVLLMIVAGLVGYGLSKLSFEPAPLLLGFVLGRMMEENLRRALIISDGDMTSFITEPLSGSFLAIALVLFVWAVTPKALSFRAKACAE
jgi:putative tricarboxylic transport membrane protein